MVANITYSYTIELGPTEEEAFHDNRFFSGFHVDMSQLVNIVKRAYSGLREYLRSFVHKPNKSTRDHTERLCYNHYIEFKKNLTGYWSRT
jgi:hypothetical protein